MSLLTRHLTSVVCWTGRFFFFKSLLENNDYNHVPFIEYLNYSSLLSEIALTSCSRSCNHIFVGGVFGYELREMLILRNQSCCLSDIYLKCIFSESTCLCELLVCCDGSIRIYLHKLNHWLKYHRFLHVPTILHSISGVIVVRFCSLYTHFLTLKQVALAFSVLPLLSR